MAAHRYWRFRNSTGTNNPNFMSCATLGFFETAGGSDLAPSATAISSTNFGTGFEANKATDGNASTFFFSNGTINAYIGVDFGVGVTHDLDHFTFQCEPSTGVSGPKDIQCEFSDDGTTWTLAKAFPSLTWTAGQTQTFQVAATKAVGTRNTQSDALVAIHIPTAGTNSTEGLVLTAINFPAVGERSTDVRAMVVGKPTTSLRNTESFALVAVLTGAEERLLRAWTFTQDGHDFYVLLAAGETYVYDKETDAWCQWASPDASFWRGVDGVDWEGINVCIDPDSGKVYKIDPQGRLDNGTTPITSIVYGGLTERFRDMPSCYMAEIAISQNSPPHNVDPTTLSITLETTDTVNTYNHGTIFGSTTGNMTYPRFYGLGLLHSPGVLFKITDTGFARRIDGLNIEVSGTPSDG